MRAEIDAVALTDHNGGGWVDKLKQERDLMRQEGADGFRELVLFPGAEVTAAGSVHLLAIFDPDRKTAHIDELMSVLELPVGQRGDHRASTGKSQLEIAMEVERLGGLLIPAHVDRPRGIAETDDRGKVKVDNRDTLKLLESRYAFALEKIEGGSPLPAALRNACDSWPCVLGSDWHNKPDTPHTEPGERFTWVKAATLDLEGLRLALRVGTGKGIGAPTMEPPTATPGRICRSPGSKSVARSTPG